MPRISSSISGRVPVGAIRLAGRLDTRVAADVRLVLADAVDQGAGDVEVDLAAVTGVDAAGLGVLLGAHRRAGRAGRRLVLLDVPPPVERMLLLTRLDRVLAQRRGDR